LQIDLNKKQNKTSKVNLHSVLSNGQNWYSKMQ